MEQIKIGEFKSRIEQVTGKRLHKTTYARYMKLGLIPTNKLKKKILKLSVNSVLNEIVEYESLSHSEKIKRGNLIKREKEAAQKWCLIRR